VLATSGLGAASASKKRHRVAATVTIEYNRPGAEFLGDISSKRAACEKKRTVNVYEQLPTGDRLVGSTASYDEGYGTRWLLFMEAPEAGTYYAKLTRKRLSPRVVCLASRSASIPAAPSSGPPGPPVAY
jgi:hypothetical protein